MKRILVFGFALGLGILAVANPADACHHRRHRRGCGGGYRGGCGDSYAPAYYDGKSGGYAVPNAEGVPAPPPPPPAPPAPRAT
jgi:hypothetical protein